MKERKHSCSHREGSSTTLHLQQKLFDAHVESLMEGNGKHNKVGFSNGKYDLK